MNSLSLDTTLESETSSDSKSWRQKQKCSGMSESERKFIPKLRVGTPAGLSASRGTFWGQGAVRGENVGRRERVAMKTKCLSSPGDKEVPSFDNSCQCHTHHTAGRRGRGTQEESVSGGTRSDFQ